MQPFNYDVVYINNNQSSNTMKYFKIYLLLLLCSLSGFTMMSQEDDNYLEFNDRKKIVHGVYLGLSTHFGEIDGKETYRMGIKVAYVANRQLEIGVAAGGFYSQQNLSGIISSVNQDLIGGYAGIHLEPILFGKSRVNLSFPLLVGAGGIAYVDGDLFDDDNYEESETQESDGLFIIEPGVSVIYNVSRFLQIEAGIKYRFSSKIDLTPSPLERINGFSAGVGVKVGIFNMGKNRYKKNLNDD